MLRWFKKSSSSPAPRARTRCKLHTTYGHMERSDVGRPYSLANNWQPRNV